LQSFKNIRVDDFFCNFLDKRFCFFFLKLEQIFIFQRSHDYRSYWYFFYGLYIHLFNNLCFDIIIDLPKRLKSKPFTIYEEHYSRYSNLGYFIQPLFLNKKCKSWKDLKWHF
ncbi:MAG: hypothetical protein LBH67_01475, partial [Rickettsia sp.]|nr:hypothetical protein [Rickettsia sp.]